MKLCTREFFEEGARAGKNALLGLLALGSVVYTSWSFFVEPSLLRKEISVYADSNRDGVTSVEEWKSMYKQLGVHYDELKPRKIPTYIMSDYVEARKLEERKRFDEALKKLSAR